MKYHNLVTTIMRRLSRYAWVCAIVTWLAMTVLVGAIRPAPADAQPHLLVISIDGLIPDYYVRPDRLGLRIPHLRRLCRDGAFATGVIGVYPSVTYPSHTTLVTSVKPNEHGITSNKVFDDPTKPPTKRWYWESSYIKTDTLWTAAKRSGLSVASLFWPATAGSKAIDWNVPEIWDPFANPIFSADILARNATPGLVEEILANQKMSLKDYRHSDPTATAAAIYLIEKYRPNLLFLHLIDLDHQQHVHGPYSAEAFDITEKEDANLGKILDAIRRAGIESTTTVAIVSDHGFMRVDKEFNAGVILVQNELIRLDQDHRVSSWDATLHTDGAVAAIILRDSSNQTLVRQIKALFDPYTRGPGAPLRRVLTREEFIPLGANPNAALFLEPAAHVAIKENLTGPLVTSTPRMDRGNHGYLPDRPEMYASFILWGRGVRARSRVEIIRMTDVAPTLARLLDLQLHSRTAQPLTDMVESPISHPPIQHE